MKTELLIEALTPMETNAVVESVNEGKNVYLNGIFMQSGIKNRNNRVYPSSEIIRVVNEASMRIKENNGIFGELDHPQSLLINLDRISHVIEDLRMEGDNAIGRARILDTPMGKIAKTLIESGVRLGVSSRGTGAVNEGTVCDYQFVTVDLVATPSAKDAMPRPVYESLEMSKNGKHVLSLAEQIREDAAAQKYFVREIKKFILEMYTKK